MRLKTQKRMYAEHFWVFWPRTFLPLVYIHCTVSSPLLRAADRSLPEFKSSSIAQRVWRCICNKRSGSLMRAAAFLKAWRERGMMRLAHRVEYVYGEEVPGSAISIYGIWN